MKLSFSNIAWKAEQDEAVYKLLRDYGFSGLEIAPTRIFPESPYDHLKEADEWARQLKSRYLLEISSMQSIWRGRVENLFGSQQERQALLGYTRKAIDFAGAIGCHNLVFGCPKNRVVGSDTTQEQIKEIFNCIGNYAAAHNTVFSLEPVAESYGTNFATNTVEALQLIKEVNNPGFRLNLDLGTMISNGESADLLRGNVQYINHVHISEPGLKEIQCRCLHSEVFRILNSEGYDKYISVEMGAVTDISQISDVSNYVTRCTVMNS